LPKGGIPLFDKEGIGEISAEHVWSILDFLVNYLLQLYPESYHKTIPAIKVRTIWPPQAGLEQSLIINDVVR
jgi:hypothetical protein